MQKLRDSNLMQMSLFALIISSVTLNAISHVLLRKAMLAINAHGAPQSYFDLAYHAAINPFLLLGMSLYAVSIVIWLFVLSKIEVSVAYPFQSIGYVIAAVIGFSLLGENVTISRAFGIALICGGLVFIARSA